MSGIQCACGRMKNGRKCPKCDAGAARPEPVKRPGRDRSKPAFTLTPAQERYRGGLQPLPSRERGRLPAARVEVVKRKFKPHYNGIVDF